MQNLLGEEYDLSAKVPVIRMTRKDAAALEREVMWFDHRQVCRHVLQYVADGSEPESLTACFFYRAGHCKMDTDGAVTCAFESRQDDVWRKAQDWRFVVGVGAVHRSLWSKYGISANDPVMVPGSVKPATNGRNNNGKH